MRTFLSRRRAITAPIRVGAKGCPATGALIGSAAVTPPVAPATGGAFDARLRNNPVAGTVRPATICAFSSQGGVAGPFATTPG